jgi:hypothetical protein
MGCRKPSIPTVLPAQNGEDMTTNPVIETMLERKSIRRYTDETPAQDVIATIVRAGQQAPLASQLYRLLLSRDRSKNPLDAPLLFTICVDLHKLELLMVRRNWQLVTNDLLLLLFGAEDACLMAENMVIAAESLGEDGYPDLNEESLSRAMREMDDGYLAQDYYREANAMIPLEADCEETFPFDIYGLTEHISREWRQWFLSPLDFLDQLSRHGFSLDFPAPRQGSDQDR